VGSVGRNTIDDAAMAAAVSAARSDPPQLMSILNDGRTVRRCITSAAPQKPWSLLPAPTWPQSSFGAVCASMK
jgi:hypothetical protein